jgi:hypothetical protein
MRGKWGTNSMMLSITVKTSKWLAPKGIQW